MVACQWTRHRAAQSAAATFACLIRRGGAVGNFSENCALSSSSLSLCLSQRSSSAADAAREKFFQPKDLVWLDPCDECIAGHMTDRCSGRWLTRSYWHGSVSRGGCPCRGKRCRLWGRGRNLCGWRWRRVRTAGSCAGGSGSVRCGYKCWRGGRQVTRELADRSRRPHVSPLTSSAAVRQSGCGAAMRIPGGAHAKIGAF